MWFYGHKHISSGYYIITSQIDRIDQSSGYTTTLELTRVAGDEGYSKDYLSGNDSSKPNGLKNRLFDDSGIY